MQIRISQVVLEISPQQKKKIHYRLTNGRQLKYLIAVDRRHLIYIFIILSVKFFLDIFTFSLRVLKDFFSITKIIFFYNEYVIN